MSKRGSCNPYVDLGRCVCRYTTLVLSAYWLCYLPLGVRADGAEALAHDAARYAPEVLDHGTHADDAEALAHDVARCRQSCLNTVPTATATTLKHLHMTPLAAARGA